MKYSIYFYDGVLETIVAMPSSIKARFARMFDLIERHGCYLGELHSKALGDGLFEIRVKAQAGIARGFYCYRQEQRIIILHAFVKKSQKTPKNELNTARKRLSEVRS